MLKCLPPSQAACAGLLSGCLLAAMHARPAPHGLSGVQGGLGSSQGNASPPGLLSHPSGGAAAPREGIAGGGLGSTEMGSGSLMSTSSMREGSHAGQGSGPPEAGAEGVSREQRPKRVSTQVETCLL